MLRVNTFWSGRRVTGNKESPEGDREFMVGAGGKGLIICCWGKYKKRGAGGKRMSYNKEVLFQENEAIPVQSEGGEEEHQK